VEGRQRVVGRGHLPEREVMTAIGPVAVRQPRVCDREVTANNPGGIRFSPAILAPYMGRSKSIGTLLPILYLSSFHRSARIVWMRLRCDIMQPNTQTGGDPI
jgi:putative transposase